MDIDRRTPENTAIVLIDYIVGFANLFRSQPLADNINGSVALAKIAKGYGVPLVVTQGPKNDRRGPLYPEIAKVIGDYPVIHRNGTYDAFDDPAFEAAVTATGRRHLVIAGIMSEGCVLQTALGALRRDYTISMVVDATAGESSVTHDAAMTRLTQFGATPTTWLSFASELHRSWDNQEKIRVMIDLQTQCSPRFGMNLIAVAAAQAANNPLPIPQSEGAANSSSVTRNS